MPVLTIIIPCYNHGRFLNDAVDSALAQTFQDLEIVIVNDGSTDATTNRLLANYQRPKTTVIQTENRGVSAACNTAIQNSTGRYLLILDADDRIAPTYAEKAIPILESRPNVGIVYCRAELFGTKQGPWKLAPYSLPGILRENMIFTTAFFRRADWETLGGLREGIRGEDHDRWLSILELGREVVQIPEVLFFYRRHRNKRLHRSRLHTRRQQAEDTHRTFLDHRDLYAQHPEVLFTWIRQLNLEIAELKDNRLSRRILAALSRLFSR